MNKQKTEIIKRLGLISFILMLFFVILLNCEPNEPSPGQTKSLIRFNRWAQEDFVKMIEDSVELELHLEMNILPGDQNKELRAKIRTTRKRGYNTYIKPITLNIPATVWNGWQDIKIYKFHELVGESDPKNPSIPLLEYGDEDSIKVQLQVRESDEWKNAGHDYVGYTNIYNPHASYTIEVDNNNDIYRELERDGTPIPLTFWAALGSDAPNKVDVLLQARKDGETKTQCRARLNDMNGDSDVEVKMEIGGHLALGSYKVWAELGTATSDTINLTISYPCSLKKTIVWEVDNVTWKNGTDSTTYFVPVDQDMVNYAFNVGKIGCEFRDDSTNTILPDTDNPYIVIERAGQPDFEEADEFVEKYRTKDGRHYIGAVQRLGDELGNPTTPKTPGIGSYADEYILIGSEDEPANWDKTIIHECGHAIADLSHPEEKPFEHDTDGYEYCVMYQDSYHEKTTSQGSITYWHDTVPHFCKECVENLRSIE